MRVSDCSPPNTVIGIETRHLLPPGGQRPHIAALQIPSSVLKLALHGLKILMVLVLQPSKYRHRYWNKISTIFYGFDDLLQPSKYRHRYWNFWWGGEYRDRKWLQPSKYRHRYWNKLFSTHTSASLLYCSPPNTVIGIETPERDRVILDLAIIAALQIPSSVLKQ